MATLQGWQMNVVNVRIVRPTIGTTKNVEMVLVDDHALKKVTRVVSFKNQKTGCTAP